VTARRTRAEKQAETRAALLDAAARVIVRRGLGAASVEEIAAEAGFTRGAFYSNFASKDELFAALLQERVYAQYAQMARDVQAGHRLSARETGEQLAEIQAHPDGTWLSPLWLEVLAHAARDRQTRRLAAGFWSANRQLTAAALEQAFAEVGREPPVPTDHLATALIAVDIGLALQHFVDPQAAPLHLYPELYELLFGALERDGQ